MKRYVKAIKSFDNLQMHEMYELATQFFYDGKKGGVYYVIVANGGFGDKLYVYHSKYFE